MTEGIDLGDDSFLAKYMSEVPPVEQPKPGDGLYVVKRREGISFVPVSPRNPDGDDSHFVDLSANLLDGNVKMINLDQLRAEGALNKPVTDTAQDETPAPNQGNNPDTAEATETIQGPEQKAKKNFAEKFIHPITNFLKDTVIEAGDALARIKEATSSMSFSNDIWETYIAEAEGKPVEHIGGIPLPKEYPIIQKKPKDFIIAGHMGFGERALPSHDKSGEGLQEVANTLTALELGVQSGANLLEIDLALSSDGEIMVYHKLPGQKDGQTTAQEFLNKSPESLTLSESISWLLEQAESVELFLELKSEIPLDTLIDQIKKAIPQKVDEAGNLIDDADKLNQTLSRLCIYAYRGSDMLKNRSGKEILRQKKELGIPKDQLKLFYITNGILTKEAVTKILDENDGIYAFEQGMMPWGLVGEGVPGLLKKMVGLMSKSSIEDMIAEVHRRGVKIITGTANDPAAIHELVRMGFDGLVPDNPIDLEMAGIKIESYSPKPKLNEFVPESMRERIATTNQTAEQNRASAEQDRLKRAERWQNRRQTVKRLLGIAKVPTAA